MSAIDFQSNKSHRLSFIEPARSEQLAEFCGIMLGDGGISAYQIMITLHRENDKEYALYVTSLIQALFGLIPSMYEKKSSLAIDLVISRIGLTDFLVNKCGLKRGNKIKQSADIPSWIKENEAFKIACVRGLVDTDGSIFTHSYISKGKQYSYKKLSFTSVSSPLLESVQKIFIEKGLRARIGSVYDVRLDSKSDMQDYFGIFGSQNPKHLKRYAS
jgi:hypothetical protein